ncbi:MAG: hypothetical protein JNJ61_04315, partial [Anaerolineae bacterium]|nr:hypothetical protein [Anaerolineae bacterium]
EQIERQGHPGQQITDQEKAAREQERAELKLVNELEALADQIAFSVHRLPKVALMNPVNVDTARRALKKARQVLDEIDIP